MQTFYGLDTSKWQGQITQTEIDATKAAGKTFWYIKGSGGDNGLYVDPQFQNSIHLLRLNSFKIGVYHFAGLQSNDPVIEANYVMGNVWRQLKTNEIAILDVDTFGSGDPAFAKAFLDVATPALGFKPVLYMNQETENNADWSIIVAEGYGLIIANYSVPPSGNVALKHWRFYLGQQYSSTGTVGSMHPVDLDAIFVNVLDDWDKYGKPAPVVVTPPVAASTAPVEVPVTPTPEPTPATPEQAQTPPTVEPTPPTNTTQPPVQQPVVVATPIPTLKESSIDVAIRTIRTYVAAIFAIYTSGGLNITHLSTADNLKVSGIAAAATAFINAGIKFYKSTRA